MRNFSLVGALATAALLVATAPAAASVQAHASRAVVSASRASSLAQQHSTALKNFEAYSDFTATGENGAPCLSLIVSANWGDYGCRNRDESFGNLMSVAVRLYYSPNQAGAWVCVPSEWNSTNLSGYTFNNGSGRPGYGQYIWNNIASSSVSTGNDCSNPI